MFNQFNLFISIFFPLCLWERKKEEPSDQQQHCRVSFGRRFGEERLYQITARTQSKTTQLLYQTDDLINTPTPTGTYKRPRRLISTALLLFPPSLSAFFQAAVPKDLYSFARLHCGLHGWHLSHLQT